MNGKNYYLIIAFNIALSIIIFPQKKFNKIAEINWIQIDSMNEERFQHAIAVLPNGNILVSGGSGGGQGNPDKRSAEIYDFNTGKWRYTNPMNVPRSLHKLLLLKTGKVMAIGGYKERSCELFDPITETWTMTDSIPTLRATGYTVTELNDGRVLIAGGFRLTDDYKEMVYLSNCEIYDPDIRKWKTVASLNNGKYNHSAILLKDGKVMISGGTTKTESAISECELFDPANNIWSLTAPLNEPRSNPSSILLPDGNVFVSGGGDFVTVDNITYYDYKKTAEIFSVKNNTWISTNSMKYGRWGHDIYFLKSKNYLLIIGGNSSYETWETYDPINLLPIEAGLLPINNTYTNNSVQLNDDRIALIGGLESDESSGVLSLLPTKKCYILNLVTNIEELQKIKEDYILLQNYPNPFNPSTTIEYYLPRSGKVTIKIFDSLGKEIETLVNEHKQAGLYQIIFNARNLPSGVYYYTLEYDNNRITKKMTLLK
ncbi:MAG: kelch repeat-containing protein [Melioribacteraceae bacterium]